MIKHRFILRDASDFKVFAAIPVESSLLTWKKWVRPPDWETLTSIVVRLIDHTVKGEAGFTIFRAAADQLHAIASEDGPAFHPEIREQMQDHSAWAVSGYMEVKQGQQWLQDLLALLDKHGAEQDYNRVIDKLVNMVSHDMDPHGALDSIRERYHNYARNYVAAGGTNHGGLALTRALCSGADQVHESIGCIKQEAKALADLRASDPLPTTLCPPGLPFAAYTVEFDGTVASVVEGCAWVSSRALPPVSEAEKARVTQQAVREIRRLQAVADATGERQEGQIKLTDRKDFAVAPATDEEKRVVEIVSQMLCERSLNPKADTRIPVREIDPAKAHQTREAERRDTAKAHPTVRTIKFEVTPPRYLREAAEHILSNPRKAHWVIGHWRNQPFGEKRAFHRQTWIKPHIRGLGEASATTARVVAPHTVTT